MRKFIVNVNGSSYEVEVEEIAAGSAAPVKAAAPAPAPAAVPAAPVAANAGQEPIDCPMPGTIVDVKVKAGDAVKSGDVLVILEAMKMENEILAPRDGKVAAVNVAKGATVNSGDTLLILA
ncbi:MAG: biotin/lipoyl-binding protein [Christensenellaceae bacterium]|jgi:biotin carboxyl carrier protein|nr:biotin/lipoyl-binding protein [Christensenellaceae bacterium]